MASGGARDKRVFAAVAATREFLEHNYAASKIELEAKLIDVHLGNPPFEPHHLHNATQYLIRSGEIIRTCGATSDSSVCLANQWRTLPWL